MKKLINDPADVVAVVTNDDVAVQDSLHTAGRRGVGVTVLVEKIAGAAAEQGRSLARGRRGRKEGQRSRPPSPPRRVASGEM